MESMTVRARVEPRTSFDERDDVLGPLAARLNSGSKKVDSRHRAREILARLCARTVAHVCPRGFDINGVAEKREGRSGRRG